jgi:uncharacterized membrane protein
MSDLPRLLIGTVTLRPYVFAFLAVYLVAAAAQLGWKRTLAYLPLGYCIAWISEFSSIHWGFPYGDYFYIPTTIDRELWAFGVPFMDSLSYVFLSYCSYSTAIFLLSPVYFGNGGLLILETRRVRRAWQTVVLGAFLFVLLDIIIDPVALQGYRWFLGQIYGYRHAGLYFGIPMSNFAGWLVVGLVMIAALGRLDRVSALEPAGSSPLSAIPAIRLFGPLLYVSVLAFNLAVTFWIGEHLLGLVGCLILFFCALMSVFWTRYKIEHLSPKAVREHLRDFPSLAGNRAIEPLLEGALPDNSA